jgi:hypothetical protein
MVKEMDDNPQFSHHQIVAVDCDLDLLDIRAQSNVKMWRSKAVILNALRTVCGVRMTVHVYDVRSL